MNSQTISNGDGDTIRLVNPNLGHPKFIQLPNLKEGLKIEFQILLVSSLEAPDMVRQILESTLSIIPVIEYKWKLQRIMEERKKGLKSIWNRIKNVFKRKSKKKKEISEKLSKLEPRGYRGDPIEVSIIDIKAQKEGEIDTINYLKNEFCIPQKYLREWNVFGGLNHYYCIKVSLSLSKEALDYLKGRDFIMCDIEAKDNNTAYHSLVLTKKNWMDFNFLHITDTHLAQRNDRIYEVVTNWQSSSLISSIGEFFGDIGAKLKAIFSRDSEQQEEQHREEEANQKAKVLRKSLDKRFVNPNNQLRKLITIANQKVLNNELDFIILTGDIVDFVIKSEFSDSIIDLNKIEFEKTNWSVFHDIILNKTPKRRYAGVLRGQELLCPLFTIVGNHDFRPYHYDLKWAGLYNKIGLTSSEASALNEFYSANPISSITKSNLALKPYLKHINPSLDFSISLGNAEFVFLNSGSDSFKNFRDMLSGHPSVTGLDERQITYLENIINTKYSMGKNVILLIHGPPINIGKSKYFRKRLEEIGKTEIRKRIDDFKESILRKLGKEESSVRIDTSFNVKHGTVSNKWEELIQFCKDYTILTLSGHTHVLKEFRLGDTKEKSTVFDAPPFILKKLENPAAVFYDVYSERIDTPEDIEKEGPFIVQTPALGLGSYTKPKMGRAYRVIKFKDGKLASFKPYFLE
jgi:Icc-related predicted phosphoesterase